MDGGDVQLDVYLLNTIDKVFRCLILWILVFFVLRYEMVFVYV